MKQTIVWVFFLLTLLVFAGAAPRAFATTSHYTNFNGTFTVSNVVYHPAVPSVSFDFSNVISNEGSITTINGAFFTIDNAAENYQIFYYDNVPACTYNSQSNAGHCDSVTLTNGGETGAYTNQPVWFYFSAWGIGTVESQQTSLVAPNQLPQVGVITASPNPVPINTAIAASANFTDPNLSDTHTASWNWGDGNTTSGTVTETNGSGSVSDNHTYATPNIYTIVLTVTDNNGGQGTQTFQYVSVYSPTSQGLFTAGQHFDSPAGAYPQNSSLTGRVRFGLSYKYQGTMPVSDKQFTMDFQAANLAFNATTISSLVLANGMATLTGSGTINGSGNYTFLVTGVNGGGIRIQITDPANNNTVIYDTQPGTTATTTPTTSVTGNVIVHN